MQVALKHWATGCSSSCPHRLFVDKLLHFKARAEKPETFAMLLCMEKMNEEYESHRDDKTICSWLDEKDFPTVLNLSCYPEKGNAVQLYDFEAEKLGKAIARRRKPTVFGKLTKLQLVEGREIHIASLRDLSIQYPVYEQPEDKILDLQGATSAEVLVISQLLSLPGSAPEIE